jgi:hypothetical protein
MEKKTEESKNKSTSSNAAEALDSINSDVRRGPRSSQRLRRKMEATIEAKARKRRSREVAASTALRQQLGKN